MCVQKQYALQFVDGLILAYPTRRAAEAAREQMKRYHPTTKHSVLLGRTTTFSVHGKSSKSNRGHNGNY